MNDVFEKFEKLNSLVSVEDVFDYIGAQVAKDDGYKKTYTCPYHEDASPSLLVDQLTGKFNCFACECGGNGAYSCAKYYLYFQNDVKPSMMQIVTFLEKVNPMVAAIKHLFHVSRVREYDDSVDKRKNFRNRISTTQTASIINGAKKSFNLEQKKIYIDAIMMNMPDEFILSALKIQKVEKQGRGGSEEFLDLLGGDDE